MIFLFYSQIKTDLAKKQDVMTLSDSDDVQTISSGSEDREKEREKVPPGERCFSKHWIFLYMYHGFNVFFVSFLL